MSLYGYGVILFLSLSGLLAGLCLENEFMKTCEHEDLEEQNRPQLFLVIFL